MTRTILRAAALTIVAAITYVSVRLVAYIAGLVARVRAAERERDRLRSERMPTVQDVRRDKS